MEFLKSLVPAVISGEGSAEQFGAVPRETGPRLIRIKRLGLLVMGQTIDEDPLDHVAAVDSGLRSSRSARRNQSPQKGTAKLNHSVYCSANLLCFVFITISAHYLGQFSGHYLSSSSL